MTEMKIISGMHCKKDMNISVIDMRDDEENSDSITGWLIYGVCNKCKTIFICETFMQINKPILGQDYLIDYKKTAQGDDLKIESEK